MPVINGKPLVPEWERYINAIDPDKTLSGETRALMHDAFYAGVATAGALFMADAADRPPVKRFPAAIAEAHAFLTRMRKG